MKRSGHKRDAYATWIRVRDDSYDDEEYQDVEVVVQREGGTFYIDGLRDGWYVVIPGDAFDLTNPDGTLLSCEHCGFQATHLAQLIASSESDEVLCRNCAALGQADDLG